MKLFRNNFLDVIKNESNLSDLITEKFTSAKSSIESLDDKVDFVSRERYSKLTYSGYKKISRLNPKTALIAFSIDDVYAIGELVRRQKVVQL